ncbi:MAG: hypothetical protein JXR71_09545 [Bacteroidales bacterium]|nr:hypothetical protein [Bacteroidales bacterium]
MKKITFLIVALLAASFTFGQMKYKPKVIVVVLGQHNPTFEESTFPDLQFYYTPEMVLKTNTILGKASKNVNKNAWSTAIGFGRSAGSEAHDSYTGSPEILVNKGIHSGVTYLLDKNGDIVGKTYNGEKADFTSNTPMLVDFKKFQRKIVSEPLGDLLKSLIKKGETAGDRKKADYQDIGTKFMDFNVADVNGTEHSMSSLIKGNEATLVVFIYINSKYDLKEAKKSGAGKKGRDYMNSVAQIVAAERQIAPLYSLEKGIFGKRIKD